VRRHYGVMPDRSVRQPVAVLPGAAECNAYRHCLLQPARDDTPVDGSRLVGVRSAARHVGDGRKSPEVSSGGRGRGGERSVGFGRASGGGRIYGGTGGPAGVRSDVADTPGRPLIRPIFGLDMRGAGQPGRLKPV